ncbi:uncharacterized protein DDB_G0284459 [Rhodamnia argentea]|uniref:Uncharacterized protein DDB_G0284459 n=1 Tax=Rhodamnia argentea TaxID=178133 RepID=A0A8B8MTE0_9MYRT|nr:uncharacterized protein DDB_G0284459 [Rhodamnia argentea]
MADADTCTKKQGLISERNPARTSKFFTHFLFKALIVAVFLVVLPLFPSHAPEFINQTVPNRSWELLHIVFVGIAVSYGLFSRRSNEEAEKESGGPSKFDSAQSYVSRFLHVSSVFDEEADSPSGSDENRVQTWSSQYFRNEPMVVVAPESASADEEIGMSSRIGEKPLLLPVRSLKSRVADDSSDTADEHSGMSNSFSRSSSNFGSKRVSKSSIKKRKGPLVDLDLVGPEENSKENNVVLPSPIPWRSRSGRMEVKEDIDIPSMEESETNLHEARPFRPQTSRSSRPNSATASPKLSPSPSLSSPRKLSPSPSLSSESQTKTPEDLVRKRNSHKYSSPPVPPPPPPPPPMNFRSSSMKLNSSLSSQVNGISYEKDMRRSFSCEYKDTNASNREIPMRKANSGTWKGKDTRDYYPNEEAETEFEDDLVNPPRRKTVGFNQIPFATDKWTPESTVQKPYSRESPKEGRPEFLEKMIVESNEDSESEEDAFEGALCNDQVEADSSSISDGGPDVDKKADEFIAKFREQIRLQRIQSIKRSSAEISRNASR